MRKSLLFALQPWPADGLKQKKSLEKDKIFFFLISTIGSVGGGRVVCVAVCTDGSERFNSEHRNR